MAAHKLEKAGGTVIGYQPQVDESKDLPTSPGGGVSDDPRRGQAGDRRCDFYWNGNVDQDKHRVVI